MLNTRPVEQAAELSRLLAQIGCESIEAAAIAIIPGWDAAKLEATRLDLRAGRFDWVILPSQNAGAALRADLGTARLVCGAATAEALGLGPEIALDRFSATAALEALQSRVGPGARVLVPRAAEGRDELLDGLRALGLEVSAPVAYRTVPVDDAATRLRAGGIDVVTACSPSAVRSLASAMSPEVLLVCLGETTAEAARQLNLRVDAIAARTTMESLVEAVRKLPLPVGEAVSRGEGCVWAATPPSPDAAVSASPTGRGASSEVRA